MGTVVVATRPGGWTRRGWAVAGLALVVVSAQRAGLDLAGRFNSAGLSQVEEFFRAMFQPELSGSFVWLAVREAGVTLGFAVLGTALSVVIGLVGGIVLSERVWRNLTGKLDRGRRPWRLFRVGFAGPRAIHEVIFGLILVNILGLDPLVAVLAIGLPFGAVTAKVFSELLDEAPADAERMLRAAGAGRLSALVFGAVPFALSDLISYGFYRFECAIRSAAVLGLVGAGGLGFQLALSFQSLRYDEMWTMLWALILLSGAADRWSSLVRRRRNLAVAETHGELSKAPPKRDRVLWASAAIFVGSIPFAWWWLEVNITSLWSARSRHLGAELAGDAWPPQLGAEGWSGLASDTIDTLALGVLAAVVAWTLASVVAFLAARTGTGLGQPSLARKLVSPIVRFLLLVARAVPPPVWAFMAVFVIRPGLWPGVAALALYNLGVLGRLQSEVVENLDRSPGVALNALGATSFGVATMATLPAVSGRFAALGLYRWEVAIRETVIVGVVGAAGLGRTIRTQSVSFDFDGILGSILALVAITVAVDVISSNIRRNLR